MIDPHYFLMLGRYGPMTAMLADPYAKHCALPDKTAVVRLDALATLFERAEYRLSAYPLIRRRRLGRNPWVGLAEGVEWPGLTDPVGVLEK